MEHKDFVIELAKKVGELMRQNFQLGMGRQLKEDRTPVTVTDLAINDLVTKAVAKHFPDYGLISEEGSNYSGQRMTWVCDPIDGTIPFSHGIPACVFMLALLENGASILGVVYDPFMDRLYFAEKGKGAFLNGKRISVSNDSNIGDSVVSLLTWKGAPFDLREVYSKLLDTKCFTFDVECIGYADVMVANGEFGGTIFSGPHSWDSAAPKVIVEEAGGKFTDLYGNEPDFRGKINGHIASNGIMHDQFLNLVSPHLP